MSATSMALPWCTLSVQLLVALGLGSPITDKDAYWTMTAIVQNLPRAVANGKDEEARTMMAYAENVAGMAFSNAGLGMVHAMAHALGGHYNLPHGVCNAVLLPYVLAFNSRSPVCRQRFVSIAGAMGLPVNLGEAHAAEAVIQFVKQLSGSVGIPATLAQLNKVDPADFGTLADLALRDTCMTTNQLTPPGRRSLPCTRRPSVGNHFHALSLHERAVPQRCGIALFVSASFRFFGCVVLFLMFLALRGGYPEKPLSASLSWNVQPRRFASLRPGTYGEKPELQRKRPQYKKADRNRTVCMVQAPACRLHCCIVIPVWVLYFLCRPRPFAPLRPGIR